jgi:hypothetical protein
MKVQRDVGGRRILLGDNTGGGAVMLRSIRFQCVGVLISTVFPYIYVTYLRPTFHHIATAYSVYALSQKTLLLVSSVPVRFGISVAVVESLRGFPQSHK